MTIPVHVHPNTRDTCVKVIELSMILLHNCEHSFFQKKVGESDGETDNTVIIAAVSATAVVILIFLITSFILAIVYYKRQKRIRRE